VLEHFSVRETWRSDFRNGRRAGRTRGCGFRCKKHRDAEMMTKSKASPGGPRPLQLLVVGKGKQAGVLEQFVRTQTELTQTSVDQADDFENAQVKLAERVYDLVLFAQDEPETQTAR